MGLARERFENDVKMYGTQTIRMPHTFIAMFENDVKMYGTQTWVKKIRSEGLFENDVKMYGTQTRMQGDCDLMLKYYYFVEVLK